jgi:hypothetical protein
VVGVAHLRGQPGPGAQLAGRREAGTLADLGDQRHCGELADTGQDHERLDLWVGCGVHDGDLGTLAMHVHPDVPSHQGLLLELVDPEA